MASLTLKTNSNRSVEIALPEPGDKPSAFLVSLPKAGSTLFYRMMKPLADRGGLPYFSLPNEMHGLGLPMREVSEGLDQVFRPQGYTYGGFRGFEAPLKLPDYAADRTVLLVRDPRDMLTSLYFSEAKSHVPPGTGASETLLRQFEARRQRALSMTIDEFVLARANGVKAGYDSVFAAIGDKPHKLFRYEDVIFAKRQWMAETLDYLALAVPPRLLDSVAERNDIRPAAEQEDQHVRRVTPGDFRAKLRPETIAALDAALAPILMRYGYERSPAAAPGDAAADAPAAAEAPRAATEEESRDAMTDARRNAQIAARREARRAARVAERRGEAGGSRD